MVINDGDGPSFIQGVISQTNAAAAAQGLKHK